MNIPKGKKPHIFITSDKKDVRDTFVEVQNLYKALGGIDSVTVQETDEGIPKDAVTVVIPDAVIYIPFEEIVDIEKEKERLNKEKEKLEGELKRVKGMLSNKNFLSKAPEKKVQEEKDKLEMYSSMMDDVMERLKALID